ncbi:hypothetical protein FRB95_000961, partial [Tulasnella sp. JGI-2019a]
MSMNQATNLPSIHSILHLSPEAGPYQEWSNGIQHVGELNNDAMNMDMEEVMSEASNAVDGSTSLSVEPEGSAMSLGSARVNGLPRLALTSTDSHLISILRQVKLGGYSDVWQGLYAPTQLRLAMKCPRIIEGTPEAIAVKRRWVREAKMWLSLNHVNILPFYGVVELSSITYLVAPWVA